MCGLVGVAGFISVDADKVFRNLLLLDQIRGFHSTGVGIVPTTMNHMKVVKDIGTPNELWYEEDKVFSKQGIVSMQSRVLMGHNRAATIGEVTKENAHPFKYGKITGAHNGTLVWYDDLEDATSFDVDSKALINDINVNGIKHTWKNFMGAAALTWWDEESSTINFIRNKDRPLYLCELEGKGSLLAWASEKWMIEAAICGTKLKIKEDEKIGNPWMLKENYLHSYRVENSKVKLVNVEELEGGKTAYTPSYNNWFRKNYRCSTKVIKSNSNVYFNSGWAKDLDRGDKEIKGTKFKLVTSLDYYDRDAEKYWYIITGKTLNGETVQIFPKTWKDWHTITNGIKENKFKDEEFIFNRRPRVIKKDNNIIYRISLEHVSSSNIVPIKKYKNKWNMECSKQQAINDLKSLGNVCGWCDTNLTVEDEYEYEYNGAAVFCKECQSETNKEILGV